MIIFIKMNDIYEEGSKSFSFFNTVNDTFMEFSNTQIWDTEEDFKKDYRGDNIDRYLSLIPKDYK